MPDAGSSKRLAKYAAKRNFKKTAEPSHRARQASRVKQLIFVVQKHAARRLHWDFRLEWQGTLRSWAVPKGPSLDPADKRLAVEVEDHPIAYAKFEGDIPKGEYGGGHVDIWDKGTWQPVGDFDKGLKKGHLEFEMFGRKLAGRWHLVRTRPNRNRVAHPNQGRPNPKVRAAVCSPPASSRCSPRSSTKCRATKVGCT